MKDDDIHTKTQQFMYTFDHCEGVSTENKNAKQDVPTKLHKYKTVNAL